MNKECFFSFKICDILTENPSWTLAHLVAHFNLVEYLSVPQVAEMIDFPDYTKYITQNLMISNQIT